MRRVSTVVLALACLVTGYSFAGSRVGATADEVLQARRFPDAVNVGQHVVLTFVVNTFGNSPSPLECTIAAVSQGWVRCEDGPTRQGVGVWYDLAHVVKVEKLETQR